MQAWEADLKTNMINFTIIIIINIVITFNVIISFKACVHYILSNFGFLPNDSPSKTMKNVFFIPSKKRFSFSRYSNVCISVFPSFSPCQPLL